MICISQVIWKNTSSNASPKTTSTILLHVCFSFSCTYTLRLSLNAAFRFCAPCIWNKLQYVPRIKEQLSVRLLKSPVLCWPPGGWFVTFQDHVIITVVCGYMCSEARLLPLHAIVFVRVDAACGRKADQISRKATVIATAVWSYSSVSSCRRMLLYCNTIF